MYSSTPDAYHFAMTGPRARFASSSFSHDGWLRRAFCCDGADIRGMTSCPRVIERVTASNVPSSEAHASRASTRSVTLVADDGCHRSSEQKDGGVPFPLTAADHQASGGGKQADAVRDGAESGAFRIEALVIMREAAPSQSAERLHGTRGGQNLRDGCEEQMNALREGILLWPRLGRRDGSRRGRRVRASPPHHGFERLPHIADLRLREFPFYRERLRAVRDDSPCVRVQTKSAPDRLRTGLSVLKRFRFRRSVRQISAEQRGCEGTRTSLTAINRAFARRDFCDNALAAARTSANAGQSDAM
jgi:hypothetical protein